MSEEKKIAPGVVVNGGQTIVAIHQDGRQEEVKVQLVAVRKFEDYMKVAGDQPAFVEFVTGKPKGWADTLTDESLYEIDSLARALNDPRFDRYLDRQREVVTNFTPMVNKAVSLTKSLPTQ